MKKLTNILLLTLVTSVALTSCKYEDGKAISLRAKRDRISNEWVVTGYEYMDKQNDSLLKTFTSGDSLQLVFTIMRSGYYNMNLQYTNIWLNKAGNLNKSLNSNLSTTIAESIWNYHQNGLYSKLGSNGQWIFANHHKEAHFGPNVNTGLSHTDKDQTLMTRIHMLSQKKLKLRFLDFEQKEHVITFEPRNSDTKSVIIR